MGLSNVIPELMMGMASLFAHKLRSLLTMLGMIFGVGAVVAMLSITAGAQKEMMIFIDDENTASAPVCVLGETTKVNLLGYDKAVGKYVKVNDTWLQVIGVLTPQATSDTDVEGVQAMNRNNLVISPLNTVMRRFEDNTSYLKDEIDGIYMKVATGTDSIETSNVVNAILAATHKDAGDFTVVVPAGLLKQRQQTQMIFSVV